MEEPIPQCTTQQPSGLLMWHLKCAHYSWGWPIRRVSASLFWPDALCLVSMSFWALDLPFLPSLLSSTRVTTCWGDSMGRCKQIASLLPLLQLATLCHPDSRWALAVWHAAAARHSLTARTKATQLPMQMEAQLQKCCCFSSLVSNNVFLVCDNKWAVIVFSFLFFASSACMSGLLLSRAAGVWVRTEETHWKGRTPEPEDIYKDLLFFFI